MSYFMLRVISNRNESNTVETNIINVKHEETMPKNCLQL